MSSGAMPTLNVGIGCGDDGSRLTRAYGSHVFYDNRAGQVKI